MFQSSLLACSGPFVGIGIFSSSLSERGNVRLVVTKFRVLLFRPYLYNYRSDSKKYWLDSPFHGGSDDTPFVGVVVAFRGSGRDLECVGCGDLIVDAVLDVIDASVVANAFILRGPFVQGKWRVSLVGDDRREGDPAGDIVLELVLGVVVDVFGGLENEWEQPILVDLCWLELVLPLLEDALLRWRRSWLAMMMEREMMADSC